jgi:capsular exopolysaccharide synthesis family protein
LELGDYLRVLRRRWRLIALATLVCAGAAVGFSLQQTPVYEATVRLVVSGAAGSVTAEEASQGQLAVQRATTYAQFASTPPVVDRAVAAAGGAAGADRPEVEAEVEPNSPFLTVTVADEDPQRAAAVANAYEDTLPRAVAQLERRREGAASTGLAVLAAAEVPDRPARPQPVRNGALGLALGLLLGVGAAYLREALDRSFRQSQQLEDETAISVLGVVPQERDSILLPTLSHPTSNRAEAYRTVRTNVQFAGPPHRFRTILVTSATAGEGKTSVATNLAAAFAATGQSVLLVDGDLRRRRVGEVFELADEGPGLAGVVAGWARLEEALRPATPEGLTLLPAGSTPDNPSELLGSPRMAELLKELGERFDVVLVDSPPVLPVTDPLVLAVNATGVLVVVRLGVTNREQVRRTISSLQKLGVPLLGLVANGAVPSHDPAYGYGYAAGYAEKRGRGTKGRRR